MSPEATKNFYEKKEEMRQMIERIYQDIEKTQYNKKYEVVQVSSMCDSLNEIVKEREKEGWSLVPPILLQPTIMENGNLYVAGQYTLTFEKKA